MIVVTDAGPLIYLAGGDRRRPCGPADGRVGAFPVGGSADGSLAWRREIDTWLAAIGARIHRAAPSEYALIGFEGSGEDLPNESARDRWVGVLRPDGNGLIYLPSTLGQGVVGVYFPATKYSNSSIAPSSGRPRRFHDHPACPTIV